jgi:uncharacterized protein YggE
MTRKLLFATFVLTASLAFTQNQPVTGVKENTVYVGADGKFEADPDTAVLNFSISAQENSSKDAYERAAKAVEQIRQVLRTNGIDPKKAEQGYVSVSPIYDWKNPKRKILGYRFSTNVTVKLTDFTKISPIVQSMSEMDVTENQSLSYMLEDMDAAKVKAVQDAFKRARSSADAVAVAGGRTLGTLAYASVDVNEQIGMVETMSNQYMMQKTMNARDAGEAPPTQDFTPQKIVINAHVNALFNMQ